LKNLNKFSFSSLLSRHSLKQASLKKRSYECKLPVTFVSNIGE